MARRGRRSGYIQIDVSDVIGEIDDDDLLAELHARNMTPALAGETIDMDILREAHVELSRGRVAEARVIIERLLVPKWRSPQQCEAAYKKLF